MYILSDHREVTVEILDFARVDGIAHVLVALERSAELDCMSKGKVSVDRRTCSATRDQTNLELTTSFMLFNCILCQLCWHCLWHTDRRESSNADGVVVADETSSLGCRHYWIIHLSILCSSYSLFLTCSILDIVHISALHELLVERESLAQ